MPIPMTAARPSDPKDWPTMRISDGEHEVRVMETWPTSTNEIAEISETLTGAGPNVVLSMTPGDPTSCSWRAEQAAGYRRTDWDVAIVAEVKVTATTDTFLVEERLVATLNGATMADVHARNSVPRDLM